MSTWIYRCEQCPGGPPPRSSGKWRIMRVGDVVTTWACDEHLAPAIIGLCVDRPSNQKLTIARIPLEDRTDE